MPDVRGLKAPQLPRSGRSGRVVLQTLERLGEFVLKRIFFGSELVKANFGAVLFHAVVSLGWGKPYVLGKIHGNLGLFHIATLGEEWDNFEDLDWNICQDKIPILLKRIPIRMISEPLPGKYLPI